MNSFTNSSQLQGSVQKHCAELDFPIYLPLISVIIPARNAQATLSQTLWSVRRQSYTNWEVIVVNDGSTDETSLVVQAHRRANLHIHEISGSGQGVSAARNMGAFRSRGSLLAFLDADDLWQPEKLMAHVLALGSAPDIGLSFDRIRFVNADATPTPVVSTRHVKDLQTQDLLCENPACTASTLVVRRRVFEAVGGFDTTLRHAEDLELMIRISATTPWRVEGINKVLTHYRASPSGASADLPKMHEGWEKVMKTVQSYAPQLWQRHGRRAAAIHMRYLARRALRLDLPAAQGLDWWKQAWQTSPSALLGQPLRSLGTLAGLLVNMLKNHAQSYLTSARSAS